MNAEGPQPLKAERVWLTLVLRVVFATMMAALLYVGASASLFLRPAGMFMPLTGYAAGIAFLLDLVGSVLSFFVPGEWLLKTIFAMSFLLWCVLLLMAIGGISASRGVFPGVVLL